MAFTHGNLTAVLQTIFLIVVRVLYFLTEDTVEKCRWMDDNTHCAIRGLLANTRSPVASERDLQPYVRDYATRVLRQKIETNVRKEANGFGVILLVSIYMLLVHRFK